MSDETTPLPEPPRDPEPPRASNPPAAGPTPAMRADQQFDRLTRSPWFATIAVGLVCLAMGLVLGVFGTVVLTRIADHHGFGDDRGHHWNDDRPRFR